MSVVLPVGLDARTFQRVPCDLIAAPLFATGLPMRGPAAWLDWRLCGLAARAAASAPAAARGSGVLLLPARGRLRASWVLLGGAGDPAAFGEAGARAWAQDATQRAAELRVGALALAIAPDRISRLALDRTIAATLAGVAAALAARPAPLRLTLVVSQPELTRAEAALAAAPRHYPGGVALRIDRADPEEPPQPIAGAAAPGLRPALSATQV
ncbi:MAG: hypothetical protein FJ091_12905 [Deltaproteobacteria bacterium]|nr:hypothetical protein [Deltaproteobacteria bacterium]